VTDTPEPPAGDESPEETGGGVTQRVEPVGLEVEMQRSYLDYAMSVIVGRALPDVRDGLKPVHRKILYAMYDSGFRPDRGYVKCARVVGDVMGNYHPHGDSSIYDALVRMGQPWSLRYPLIDGNGNFGSPGNDPPAAMRYCVTADALVRTPFGTVPIGEIVPGAEPDSETDIDLKVYDRNGDLVRASKFFHSGEHPTLKLRTREGYELTGTHNHPVLCLVSVAGVPTLLWKLLEEIQPGDRAVMQRVVPDEIGTPMLDHVEAAVLAGAFVNEGWASENRAGFNNVDGSFFARVLSAYDIAVGGQRYVGRRTIASGSEIHEIDIQDLTALRRSLIGELIGARSAQKFVPSFVWSSPPAVKRAFLQALFEGDGSSSLLARDTIQISYSTRSDRLAREVQQLLLEFGVVSRLCRYETARSRSSSPTAGMLACSRRTSASSAASSRSWSPSWARFRPPAARSPVTTCRSSVTSSGSTAPPAGPSADWLTRPQRRSDRTVGARRRKDRCAHHRGRCARCGAAVGGRPVLLRRGDERHAGRRTAGVQHPGGHRRPRVRHERVRQSQHRVEARAPRHGDAAGHRRGHRRHAGQLRRPGQGTHDPARAVPEPAGQRVRGDRGGNGHQDPPHNLREIGAAVQWCLDNPEADEVTTLDALIDIVKGPDFPTYGLIVGQSAIQDAYRTGRGSIRMRAVVEVEEDPRGRPCLVVTELPYQVNPDNLAERVAELVKEGKLTGIADIKDESSGRTGMRLIIVLKRDAVAKVVLNNLYKHTQLQETFGANMLALVDGVPRTLNLAQFIRYYVDHQIEVIRRRTAFRLRKAEERAHILRGLVKALDMLDEVIALIRRSPTVDDARTGLIQLLDIDEVQASAILDMQLRRLAAWSASGSSTSSRRSRSRSPTSRTSSPSRSGSGRSSPRSSARSCRSSATTG
jgi:DNA gyrase subunit A